MRKIEVTRDTENYCSMDGITKGIFAVKQWVGEIPPIGETRSYYIIPAGDVAEFECQTVGMYGRVEIRRVDNKFGLTEFRENFRQLFGFVPGSKDARRVTAIVHPPDEPTEDTVEAIPAKQPILLKRNNTPTRPGNYVRRFQSDSPCPSQVFEQHGKLGYRDRSGSFCLVGLSEWWSDELGPIEFEAEPEPPPMPKCGWFEWEGSQYRCIEDPNFRGDFVVFPPMEGQSNWSQTALDIKGITIHWYGDDA